MEIAFVQTFNVLALTTVNRGLTPAQYGVVMGLNGALIMLIELPLNQWARRFDLRWVLVVGYALVGLGCASFGIMRTQAGFFAAMGLFTLGEMLSLPISMSYASHLSPEKFRGRYFGTRGMVWALAGLAGSLGVWCYGRLGDNWWYVAGGIGLLGALLMLISTLQEDRRPAGV
jgi:MFS family permease